MRITSMRLIPEEHTCVLVHESRNGQGIFAAKSFLSDEIIFEVTGARITCDEDDDIDENIRANAYRYDADTYISPAGSVGDFLNHSCNPNGKVVKRDDTLFIVSLDPIKQDEEITIDYSTILGSDDSWEMKCNCGSKRCRGIIRAVGTLHPEILQRYRSRGMIPEYIS